MQTIVFYSYKGGVGRTLLLSNFALSLSRIGKKVVMIDFDFDSPGLPYKFGVDNSITKGYVDYLYEMKPSERCDEQNLRGRAQYLKDIIVKIPQSADNLSLIPAGDPMKKNYWGHLAADRFNRLFYFTEPEIEGRSDFATDFLGNNIVAFFNDKKVIEETFKPDYLLIDTKATNERVSVPMILWSDTIVSMFAAHEEGIQGTALSLRAVHDEATYGYLKRVGIDFINQRKKIVPVLCRVPENPKRLKRTKERVVSTFSEVWSDLDENAHKMPLPSDLLSDLSVLHESRTLEDNERLFMEDSFDTDKCLLLTHNYIRLFAKIVPLPDHNASNDSSEHQWFEELKVDKTIKILERYFDDYTHVGMMKNPDDDEPNIAIRIKTLHKMMISFCDNFKVDGKPIEEINEYISNALFVAGKDCGVDFGNEMMTPGKVWPSIPEDYGVRLQDWCRFDSSVGFGKIYSSDINRGVFREEEFVGRYTIKQLIDVLTNAQLLKENERSSTVEDLNRLLKRSDLYDAKVSATGQRPSASLIKLKVTCDDTKKECDIEKLNRLVLEEFYPLDTPKCLKLDAISGNIIVTNNAFAPIHKKEIRYDLGKFLSGYVEGVLNCLFSDMMTQEEYIKVEMSETDNNIYFSFVSQNKMYDIGRKDKR